MLSAVRVDVFVAQFRTTVWFALLFPHLQWTLQFLHPLSSRKMDPQLVSHSSFNRCGPDHWQGNPSILLLMLCIRLPSFLHSYSHSYLTDVRDVAVVEQPRKLAGNAR
jgi:hypothetical protein